MSWGTPPVRSMAAEPVWGTIWRSAPQVFEPVPLKTPNSDASQNEGAERICRIGCSHEHAG
eukprot:967941-Alexandrium_andersonii.AAC.1